MKIKPTRNTGGVTVELDRRDEPLMAAAVKNGTAEVWPSPLKKILVPIDFSESSKRALAYALPLAEKLGASLTLAHVVQPRMYPEDLAMGRTADDVDDCWRQYGKTMLESLKREKIDPGINATTRVAMGKPWYEIVCLAKNLDTDLIIIATHGYTGLKHVFLGSTAERVVRHAHCPVLIVREPEPETFLAPTRLDHENRAK